MIPLRLSPSAPLRWWILAAVWCTLLVAPAWAAIPVLNLGESATATLSGAVAVRYYRIPITTTDPFIVLVDTTEDQSYYQIALRPDSVMDDPVGDVRVHWIQHSILVTAPAPGDYYLEIRNRYDGDRGFTVKAESRAPTAVALSDIQADQPLWGIGDVRYFRVTAPACASLLALMRCNTSTSLYDLNLRPGTVTAEPVGGRREYYYDLTQELVNAAAGTYIIEVRDRDYGGQSFTFKAEARLAVPLAFNTPLPDQTLWAAGDVRYYRLTAPDAAPLLALLRSPSGGGYFDISLRPGTLTAEPVGVRQEHGQEFSVAVAPAIPGDYLLEVRSRYNGDYAFSVQAARRPVIALTLGQPSAPQTFLGVGDVRYFQATTPACQALLGLIRGTGNYYDYEVILHKGSLTAAAIGTRREGGSEVSVEALPAAAGTYFLEVRSRYEGARTFTARLERRDPQTLALNTDLTNQQLLGIGDVRFFKYTLATRSVLMTFLRGTTGTGDYEVTIHRNTLADPAVGTRRESGQELSVEIPAPYTGTYLVAVRSRNIGSRSFSLRGEQRVIGGLGPGITRTNQSLARYGDVQYYAFTIPEGAALLALLSGSTGADEYAMSFHATRFTTPALEVTRRVNGQEVCLELKAPKAGTYYLAVRSQGEGPKRFTIRLELRQLEPLALDALKSLTLLGHGDLRFYQVDIPQAGPLVLPFMTSWYTGEYDMALYSGGPDGSDVSRHFESGWGRDGALEASVTPGPYTLLVRNRGVGARGITFWAEPRPVTNLTPGGYLVDQPLWSYGDVRYYRIRVSAPDTPRLGINIYGADDWTSLNVALRLGSRNGAEVPMVTGGTGSIRQLLLENPVVGDYYLEVRNTWQGNRYFALDADTTVAYQPNLAVRGSEDGEFLGESLYGGPTGQTAGQAVAVGQTAQYYLKLRNDGNVADTVTLSTTATGSSVGWSGGFFLVGAAGTSPLTLPWTTPSLSVGEEILVLLSLTPSAQATGDFTVIATAGSTGNPNNVDQVACVTAIGTTPISRIYTTTADFQQGRLVGVTTATPDQLELSDALVTTPFIWVPNSNQGTISKVETRSGREVGRYRVGPQEWCNPSRTTVDLEGNCYVGNRNTGTLVKVGLLENGQWLDRNGNGVPDTSRDLDGDGNIAGTEMLAWGEDECVLFEVFLVPGSEATYVPGTCTASYPNDSNWPGTRGLAVDAQNDVWVGTYYSQKFYHIRGTDGAILRTLDTAHYSYGALIDGNGMVWSTSGGFQEVIRIDPTTEEITRIPVGHTAYGIGLDNLGHVFISGYDWQKLTRIDAATATIDWTVDAPYTARGVAVTSDNNVWTANTNYNTVTRYANDGTQLAHISVGNGPCGVSVDGDGNVWVVDVNDEYIHRINPTTNAVDLSKRILGTSHYGYSDMTGMVSRTGTTRIGTWTVIHNALVANAPWGLLTWTADTPAGTGLTVKVRSSNNRVVWSNWEIAGNGKRLGNTPPGRYLEVQVVFQRVSGTATPVLYDLTITPVQPAYQPDGILLDGEDSIGEGVYNDPLQLMTLRMLPGGTNVFDLAVTNDGNVADVVTVTGPTTTPAGWTVAYSDPLTGSPLTAEITGAGLPVSLPFAGSKALRVTLTAGAGLPGGASLEVPVVLTSTHDTGKSDTVTVKSQVVAPVSAVNLTASPTSPRPAGTELTLRAIPTGGLNLEYCFTLGTKDGTNPVTYDPTPIRAYSTDPTCTWTPPYARVWYLRVWVREVGTTVQSQAFKVMTFTAN
jgi:hypothetical protein